MKSYINAHIRAVHLKEKKHKCDFCGKEFFHAGKMRSHVEQLHMNKDPLAVKKHKCDLCPKTFDSKSRFNQHKKLYHTDDTDDESDSIEVTESIKLEDENCADDLYDNGIEVENDSKISCE